MFVTNYIWDTKLIVFAVLGCFVSRAIMLVFLAFFVNRIDFCNCKLLQDHSSSPLSSTADRDSGSSTNELESGEGDNDNSNSSRKYDKFVDNKTKFVLWFAGKFKLFSGVVSPFFPG